MFKPFICIGKVVVVLATERTIFGWNLRIHITADPIRMTLSRLYSDHSLVASAYT